jgi:bacterial/archaeal transporter family protein
MPFFRCPASPRASVLFSRLEARDASRVAPVDKVSIVLVAVFRAAFLGERLMAANWSAIVLIGCGALLVAYRG